MMCKLVNKSDFDFDIIFVCTFHADFAASARLARVVPAGVVSGNAVDVAVLGIVVGITVGAVVEPHAATR
jgi:hypothetical protein